MGNTAFDVRRLSRDEQLDLLDQLWETLGRDPEALPLSDFQRDELDRRLDELEAEGAKGLSWDEVVGPIRSRTRDAHLPTPPRGGISIPAHPERVRVDQPGAPAPGAGPAQSEEPRGGDRFPVLSDLQVCRPFGAPEG